MSDREMVVVGVMAVMLTAVGAGGLIGKLLAELATTLSFSTTDQWGSYGALAGALVGLTLLLAAWWSNYRRPKN